MIALVFFKLARPQGASRSPMSSLKGCLTSIGYFQTFNFLPIDAGFKWLQTLWPAGTFSWKNYAPNQPGSPEEPPIFQHCCPGHGWPQSNGSAKHHRGLKSTPQSETEGKAARGAHSPQLDSPTLVAPSSQLMLHCLLLLGTPINLQPYQKQLFG